MVATVTSYTDSRNRADAGQGYDGVVRVSAGGFYGTGVLLFDGRAILTAAHLFDPGVTSATVHFETAAGQQTVSSLKVSIAPGYDSSGNHDLAIVWLSAAAPVAANRHDLYRDGDELGQTTTLVGYGLPGSGTEGALESYSGSPVRLKATNRFDADIGTLKSVLGSGMAWSPVYGSQLVADFDDGTTTRDALGKLIGVHNLGHGDGEGLIASGDSGGPAFIGNLVAGVASYTASLSRAGSSPDIDSESNSSFGEVAAWQRVSFYQQWIDQSLRANYQNAPSRPEDVTKAVAEGGSGTSLNYFLLQFTGMRSDPDQILSVDYATRNGSAKAGEDYLAVSGTLLLYPGETQAVIPVEIIGDGKAEADEIFYLDLTNPVGGSFGDGVVTLTAMRTILNDDGAFFG